MSQNQELERIRLRCVCGEDGCWLWSGSVNARGLPTLSRKVDGKLRHMSGRRWVYTASGRTIHPKERVVTTCEAPNCLNPEHLKKTNLSAIQKANNRQDPGLSLRRGIAIKAAWNRKGGGAKLTREQADYARQSDKSSDVVGRELGVSGAMVRYIRAGKAWKNYSSPFAGLGA